MLSKENKIKLGIFLLLTGLLLTFSTLISRPLFDFLFPPKLSFKEYKTKEIKPEDKYPVKIKIPELDLDLAITPQKIIAKQWPVASASANYLVGSGIPGEKGNIVIYGHALPKIFGPLLNISQNEKIILETKEGRVYNYKVKEIKVVWPFDTSVIEPTNQEILTVYTCYGLFDSQRFVILAEPISLNREVVKVKRVIDGDTIELSDGRRVRYIGINSPEIRVLSLNSDSSLRTCFGKEAKEKNKELVEGKVVELEKDVSETDKYNRLLRYVFINGIFVNEYLVKNGYAQAMTIPPDVKYQKLFQEKEKEARREKRGLWGECR